MTPWAAWQDEEGVGTPATPGWSPPDPAVKEAWARHVWSGRHGPCALLGPRHLQHQLLQPPLIGTQSIGSLSSPGPVVRWLAGFKQVIYLGFVSPQHFQTNI